MKNKRVVICHYHIFKNSGSTFDALLKRNYGERHVSFDGPFVNFVIEQDQLERIIISHPNVTAFSSHQIRLPVPTSLDFLVLPVIFLRHPLLRARSIYHFVKKTTESATAITTAAQNMSFDRWVENALSNPSLLGDISNAQTGFLCGVYQRKWQRRIVAGEMEYDVDQAARNMENARLLGRTEFFDQDVSVFSRILRQYEIEFVSEKIEPENVTSSDLNKTVDERVEHVRESLSKENFENLLKANSQDMLLFDYASRLIESRGE
jgi:hypothetical protein